MMVLSLWLCGNLLVECLSLGNLHRKYFSRIQRRGDLTVSPRCLGRRLVVLEGAHCPLWRGLASSASCDFNFEFNCDFYFIFMVRCLRYIYVLLFSYIYIVLISGSKWSQLLRHHDCFASQSVNQFWPLLCHFFIILYDWSMAIYEWLSLTLICGTTAIMSTNRHLFSGERRAETWLHTRVHCSTLQQLKKVVRCGRLYFTVVHGCPFIHEIHMSCFLLRNIVVRHLHRPDKCGADNSATAPTFGYMRSFCGRLNGVNLEFGKFAEHSYTPQTMQGTIHILILWYQTENGHILIMYHYN